MCGNIVGVVDNGERAVMAGIIEKGKIKKADIDWAKVKDMCAIMCTAEEIASISRICIKTLCNRCKSDHGMTFQEFWGVHSAEGKMSLRRAQYEAATTKGNVTAQIWLGKQVLGQRDKQDHNVKLTVPTFVDDVPDEDTKP